MATTLDKNGNVLQDGYSTNLSPTEYNTISSSSLAPQKQVTIPAPTTDTTNYNGIIAPITQGIADSYTTTNQQYQDLLRQQQQAGQEQVDLMARLTGRTADLQTAQDQAGVNAEAENLRKYTEQLANINAQASSLNREAQAIPIANRLAYKGTAGTENQVQNVNYDQLQQNALKALSLGQQADIASASATGSQLRLNAAKEKAQQIVDLKYKPLEDQLAIKKQVYELNKDILTSVDKKRAETLNIALQKEQRDLEEKKANDKEVSQLIINASSVAPPDVLARAKAIQEKGGSATQVAMALGEYAGDYWGTKLKIAQYNKLVSETAKIDKQTSGLKLQPTGLVTTPNGDAVSLPNSTLNAIGQLKLNEGQSNAVAFVSRMIQANAAIKKQLGTISPTGGFYETSGYDPTSFGSGIGRAVSSDNSRIYNTNAQDFIRAKLRKESGATISPEEFTADAAIYAPSGMGLDQKDLLLAETKREEAIKSMIAQSGPAAPYLQQYYEQVKANNGVPYDPYLDGQAIPSVSKNSGTAMSSDAYGNSLVNQTQP